MQWSPPLIIFDAPYHINQSQQPVRVYTSTGMYMRTVLYQYILVLSVQQDCTVGILKPGPCARRTSATLPPNNHPWLRVAEGTVRAPTPSWVIRTLLQYQ